MMNKKWILWNCIIVVDLLAVALLVGFWIARPDLSLLQKERSYRIGASYMTMNNEFYHIIHEQISYRVEAEGDRMMLRDPALSVERQIKEIDDMLAAGIDALVLTPVDSGSLTEVLRRAKEKGVFVIVVDSNVSDEELADCTIVSDNYRAGELVGKYFLQEHDAAEVVVMAHSETRSGQERVQGFVDTVSDNPKVHIVRQMESKGQIEIALPQMQRYLQTDPVFDSVFCLNDPAAIGVVSALDEAGRLSGVDVYGVDASPAAKALIKEGKIKASAAQFPSRIGAEAADALYRLLRGQQVEANIKVPVELVTQENAEEYHIDRWQ